MTHNGNNGYRYSGIGRGNLRISLSASRGARSISVEVDKESDPEYRFFAGLSSEEFPPIQPSTSSRSTAAAAVEPPESSMLKHGGYGSDGIKTYFQTPYKYTGYGRGGTVARAGARSALVRQHVLGNEDDDDDEEEKPTTGGYGSEGIKASGPVVPRGGLQAAGQQSLETGSTKMADLESLD